MHVNPITLTDSYKNTHWKQLPPGTSNMYSYFESRGGEFEWTSLFGLQYIIKKYLLWPFATKGDVGLARMLSQDHLGADHFNKEGWDDIIDRLGGNLPVRIKAVPEGMRVPSGNVLITVESLDKRHAWLTNWLETLLSQVWYPSTIITQSRHMYDEIERYLELTGTPGLAKYKVVDFGVRGVSCMEQAMIGGGSHLASGFQVTDNFACLNWIEHYYGKYCAGQSVPASEHSTVTIWGRGNEGQAFANMLDQYPGTFACVSDSYDIFNAIKHLWGTTLRERVFKHKGTIVIRPDSGKLPDTLIDVMRCMLGTFGCVSNSKGFMVLPENIKVIQGDGIDRKSLSMILQALHEERISTDNIIFGSGGGLLQKVNRDTSKYAFKCSSAIVDGYHRDVYKEPITDPGKRSKRGRLELTRIDGKIQTVDNMKIGVGERLLETVYAGGRLLKDYTFEDVRRNIGRTT